MFIILAYFFSFIAIFLAIKLHDKYDPARYFSIFWGVQVIFIPAFFHDNFLFSTYGLVYISIACLIFSTGTLSGRLLGVYFPSRIHSYAFHHKRALFFLKVCIGISLINVVQGIYANGFNILQILSFKILLELNNVAAVNRYTNNTPSNIISQLTLIFVYLTPLYGGYLLPLLSGKTKYWCYLSIIPALLITLTQAVKLGFITSVALWCIGVLVSAYANNNTFFKIRMATILKVSLFSISFFTILFLSMVFRTGKFDLATIHAISGNLLITLLVIYLHLIFGSLIISGILNPLAG